MKMFDKNGKLLLHTLHNTYRENSYMLPPPPHRAIRDGTKGVLKRIAKEME